MGSSSKRRQTFSKMTRERAVKERRALKQEKKDEKKAAAAAARAAEAGDATPAGPRADEEGPAPDSEMLDRL
jgi:hypothetical protein